MGKMLRKWWCCLSSTRVDRCHTRNMEGLTNCNDTEHASYWRNWQLLSNWTDIIEACMDTKFHFQIYDMQSQLKWPTDILLLAASQYSEEVSVDLWSRTLYIDLPSSRRLNKKYVSAKKLFGLKVIRSLKWCNSSCGTSWAFVHHK